MGTVSLRFPLYSKNFVSYYHLNEQLGDYCLEAFRFSCLFVI